jgi:hypothetical protein
MSHAYYNEQWKSAVEDIHAISAAENPSGSGEDGAHQVCEGLLCVVEARRGAARR